MNRKAFTLIELLVVIAIIAILAAILFPVFAQAKIAAKKTAYISSVKQEGLSIAIYQGDVDDVYPMGFGVRPDGNGTWGYGVVHPVPYNVITTAPWTLPQRWLMAQCFWANACAPYAKNLGILTLPVVGNITIADLGLGADTFAPGVTPAYYGMDYNGLFHQLNASVVAAPANAVVLWHVQKLNLTGRGLATPVPYCPGSGPGSLQANPVPCSFTQVNASIFYVYDFATTSWLFDKKMVIGRADSSAKTVPVGIVITPNLASPSGQATDPWAQVGTTGVPFSYYNCGAGGPLDFGPTANYPCYFRPDRTW